MDKEYWLEELEHIDDQLAYTEMKNQRNKELIAGLELAYGDKAIEYAHVERVYGKVCHDGLKGEVAILHGLVDDGVMTQAEVLESYGDFSAKMVNYMTKSGKTCEDYYSLFAKKSMLLSVKIYEVLDMLEHCYSVEYAREIGEYFLPILKSNSSYADEYEMVREAVRKSWI